ncbi:MAG: response regulator transcription factor [Fimbriimonas sp.]|nr:response regulator transcription factor [Fimbriimonas sp.]
MLVEDEQAVLAFLTQALEQLGYEISGHATGESAIAEFRQSEPDLIVLDVMLPDIDGFEVLRKVRLESKVPVLMLTARTSLEDRVTGLDAGADDYLPKPFMLEEFLARVRALLRRSQQDTGRLQYGDLVVDTGSRKVTRGSRPIYLSATEFALLEILIRSPESPVSKQTILEKVWDDNGYRDPNVVEVYVSYLRHKLERSNMSRLIYTIRGQGYMLGKPRDED